MKHEASGGSLDGYAKALWWTGMILTKPGSDYRPRTPRGRLLTLPLSAQPGSEEELTRPHPQPAPGTSRP
jgi:hypothetical protein